MDRDVRVNATDTCLGLYRPNEPKMDSKPLRQGVPMDDVADPSEYGAASPAKSGAPLSPAPTNARGSDTAGPCLYLGPAGQRCERRALEGAFCGVHQPGGIAGKIGNPGRVLAAALTIAVLLWPYLEELVHEIIRWKHSR